MRVLDLFSGIGGFSLGLERAGMQTVDRFAEKVSPPNENNCWEWSGSKNPQGYGNFRLNGKTEKAHRVAWILFKGPIPGGAGYHGVCVCHSCDNPSCVNPQHLFLGTQSDNCQDRKTKGRQSSRLGEENGRAILTQKSAEQIKQKYRPYKNTIPMLAKEYGVSEGTIQSIIYGKTWA